MYHLSQMFFVVIRILFNLQVLMCLKILPHVTNEESEDAKLTVVDIILKHNYPVEIHNVVTNDGYILTMHRIPHGRNQFKSQSKGVVFCMHGLLSSSSDFILMGPGSALGYILADAGYDVWLGNARGNRYSRNHTILNPDVDSSDYWNFTWHEIGVLDLTQSIDYILKQTRSDAIFYIGYSQGTTAFFVMTSTVPEYNQKIRASFHLAPTTFMNHMFSPVLRMSCSLFEKNETLFKQFVGEDEFLPSDEFMRTVLPTMCDSTFGTNLICENMLFAFGGINLVDMDVTFVATMMGHTPAGASTKQIIHYCQLVNTRKARFKQFDYGTVRSNIRQYRRPIPNQYDLTMVTVPVYIWYSAQDWIASEKGADLLFMTVSNPRESIMVPTPFNHFDFIYNLKSTNLIYRNILTILNEEYYYYN